MKELSTYLFSHYASFIIFLHVLSAIIWLGGMIAIRLAVHYSVQGIEDAPIKLRTTLFNLKYFFKLVIPSIVLLLVTALIMVLAVDFKVLNLASAVYLKEGIWTMMTLVFILIYIKHVNAFKAFNKEDYKSAKAFLLTIANYLIPINILFGLGALFLGITLRGF
ncbi:hypothetical protein [Candidatus Marinarcus aquaticus]|uniref:Copper resistance protein D domain-containing protein n=1 Tax=Candidatus Marinarcus aquaticus TaxID=2044504 RepID=A0A4Q0XME6_9BACT|nr:hypothetical protein [Candidatus Marinarcus aquaticus]RXJ53705.1 hypothetical protein CRV04_12715 [Candidatus Marinarcus aquaticus]